MSGETVPPIKTPEAKKRRRKKIIEQVQNFNENMRNYERNETFFQFAKQLETLYFVFRETFETR